MEQNTALDQLTIEEYVHQSSVLSAGLSRTVEDQNAYISMIRDPKSIPFIMQSIEKDNQAASKILSLKLSLIHNVLVVYAPAFTGTSLESYAQTLQPYGTFNVIEKLIANLSQFETLDFPIFAQLLHPEKYVIDSNDMPHIQFWIDDLMVFKADLNSSTNLRQEVDLKIANLVRSAFSTDFVPKQLSFFADKIEKGTYHSCLEILHALQDARKEYYDSDSERRGEVLIKALWAKMQKRMLLIVLVLIALVYGLYWFYFSKPVVSTTVYKTRIGDVAFVIENDAGKQELESSTYVLMFPEETPQTIETNTTQETVVEEPVNQPAPSQTLVIGPGQNLFRICLEYYGDGNYYSALARYNNIQNPDLIPVGLSLEIPPLEILLESE